MKRILNAAAIQNDNRVWLDGMWIDVSFLAEDYFSKRIEKPFLLRIQLFDKELTVFDSGGMPSTSTGPLPVQKTSIDMFSLNGEIVYLELLVKE